MASPSFVGADLFAYGGHIDPKLQFLHPGVVLLGHDIWNDAVPIHRACDTNPWLILRWMDLDVSNPDHTPERAADFICAKAKPLMALGITCIAHGLNEQHTNRRRAREWELKFIERCHWHGVPTICNNWPYNNFDDDEAQDFREVWMESDYNGPHLYDRIENGEFVPRIETSLRYRKWTLPTEKILCTEFNVEDGGWQKFNFTAEQIQERVLMNVQLWKSDGMLAATYFAMSHIDDGKWGKYYGLDSMYKFWGDNSPAFEPGGNMPIPKELDEAQRLCQEGQDIFNKSVGAIWEDKGPFVAKLFYQFGDIFNRIEAAKKALSPASSSTSDIEPQMDSGLTPHSPQNLGGPDHST